MRGPAFVVLGLLATSCSGGYGPPVQPAPAERGEASGGRGAGSDARGAELAGRIAAAARELDAAYDRYRVAAIAGRRFTHAEYWAAVGPLIDAAPGLHREEIGRSAEGRPLHLVRYGDGPTRVLLWSQMHGNESTATMALADVFRFLAEAPDDPLARRLAERLTLLVVPMLNPDGAERFQRRNALGIDVNRDARALATPEGRALKAMRDRFRPDFGFNLHDQNVRIAVGGEDRTAAISLLAPPYDPARSVNEVRERAMRLAAVVRHAADAFVEGHVARYDDTFNARAFGDLMQQWGTSTVLVESGGWRDDPEKQHLRRVHFALLLTALDAIGAAAWRDADVAAYEGLPENGPTVNDLLVRGGTVVVPGAAPFGADLAFDFQDPLAREGGRIADVGDLAEYRARDTLDVRGLFVHVGPAAEPGAAGPPLAVGAPANLTVRRTADPASAAVWIIEDGRPSRAVPTHRSCK